MNKLLELTNDFAVSRPVFRLQLNDRGSSIDANAEHPVHEYRPEPISMDPLSQLVCEHYRERFDIKEGCFTVDKNDIANRAMEEIRGSIGKFIEKNLEMRNPRQSKLYRWAYRNMPNTSEINDVLVMVYKYLRSFCDTEMRSGNVEHINNGIAILEAIMEKHE